MFHKQNSRHKVLPINMQVLFTTLSLLAVFFEVEKSVSVDMQILESLLIFSLSSTFSRDTGYIHYSKSWHNQTALQKPFQIQDLGSVSMTSLLPQLQHLVLHKMWKYTHRNYSWQLAESDNLESKFKRLEGNDVDAELEQLRKGQLKGNTRSSSSSQQKLPEGRPIR